MSAQDPLLRHPFVLTAKCSVPEINTSFVMIHHNQWRFLRSNNYWRLFPTYNLSGENDRQ